MAVELDRLVSGPPPVTVAALDASVSELSPDEATSWWRWGWVCFGVSVGFIAVLALITVTLNPSERIRAIMTLIAEAALAVVTLVAAVRVSGTLAGFTRQVGLDSVTRRDLANWIKGVGWQFLALLCFGVVVTLVNPEAIRKASNVTGLAHASAVTLVIAGVAAVLIAPLVEETQFRALMLQGGMRRYGFLPAAVFSSVVFGCLHGWQVSTEAGVTVLVTRMIVFGFVQCLLVRRSGRLISNVLVHASLNLLALILVGT